MENESIKMTEKRKPGRPIGKNFTVLKQLKINEEQNEKWDRNTPKAIRDLLDGKSNAVMKDFKRLYQIMNLYMKPKSNLTDEIINELVKMEEEHNLE